MPLTRLHRNVGVDVAAAAVAEGAVHSCGCEGWTRVRRAASREAAPSHAHDFDLNDNAAAFWLATHALLLPALCCCLNSR